VGAPSTKERRVIRAGKPSLNILDGNNSGERKKGGKRALSRRKNCQEKSLVGGSRPKDESANRSIRLV